MLFHDRRTGMLVSIEHQDHLPVEKAMNMFQAAAGQYGEKNVPKPSVKFEGHEMEAEGQPSPNLPGFTTKQHRGIYAVHQILKRRAGGVSAIIDTPPTKFDNFSSQKKAGM